MDASAERHHASGRLPDARRAPGSRRRLLPLREVAARRSGVEPQQCLLPLRVQALTGKRPRTIGWPF